MITLILTVVFLMGGQPVGQQRLSFNAVFPDAQVCEVEKADQLAKYAVGDGPLARVADQIEKIGLKVLTPVPADGFRFELTCEDGSK